jgi:predicted KAP-like P-loop ATPase
MPIRFKPRPLDIPKGAPFDHDLLEREPNAKILTQFVSRLEEPFVLAVDSPWGSGKTTFLRMWLQSLENDKFPCLYFNAWQNDFSDSPLVSLIGEIGEAIRDLRLSGENEKLAREIFDKAKKSGAVLAKAALPAAVKLATAGLLDLSSLKAEDIAKLAEDLAKQQIEKYQADKKTIAHFRKELADLVAVLRRKIDNKAAKPVIFVVDELDRCRPPYAVELLEKIKHLFSVDGLIFILAIDRQQLGESVRCLYGEGLDADNYLRRFSFGLLPPDNPAANSFSFSESTNSFASAKT